MFYKHIFKPQFRWIIPTIVILALLFTIVLPILNRAEAQQGTNVDLSLVGGEDITLTFDGMTQDGITLGETSIRSQYPDGMIFSVAVTSDGGDITSVTLFRDLPNGSSERTNATYDEDTEIWTAHA